ncbi:MAG: TadE family protein [Sporichthyaceae bacterium]
MTPRRTTRRHRARACQAPRDAGTSTVELAITMPALLIAVLSVIQVGLWFHTRHVALAAAQDGARIARAYDGTENAARARTLTNLDDLAPTLLRDRSVEVTRTAEEATVTVRGTATSILGIFALTVTETVHGPVERFVAGGTR